MPKTMKDPIEIKVTLEKEMLKDMEKLINAYHFKNRGHLIRTAVRDIIIRHKARITYVSGR